MRIFLVENHPDTLRCLQRHLVRTGHEVGTARTYAQAIHDLAGQPYDLLLTDLGLPDGDGWNLLQQLGDARPPLAIAMSGRNSLEDHARSREAGFQHHLVKPFLPDGLDEVLRKVVQERDKGRGES
jgi:two-component system CheB/CheR fusion protein